MAKDNVDQSHMHLMFSELSLSGRSMRALGVFRRKRFSKRSGAKKDLEWTRRDKPDEVRERWIQMMNAAMERNGLEQRSDARS